MKASNFEHWNEFNETILPAVEIFRERNLDFALLHTTNLYPTPNHLVRLGGMQELEEKFPDALIGLSDHTLTNHACFAAVALGAKILERHFTDSMTRDGPDIECSDPAALKDLIKGVKIINSQLVAKNYRRGGRSNDRFCICNCCFYCKH